MPSSYSEKFISRSLLLEINLILRMERVEKLCCNHFKVLNHIRSILHQHRIDLHCNAIDWLLYECNFSLIWDKKKEQSKV